MEGEPGCLFLEGCRTNCFLDWRECVYECQVPDEGDCSQVDNRKHA